MMEEPLSRGASPSGDSGLSGRGEMNTNIVSALEERFLDIHMRQSVNMVRTPPTRKAKRVRFFRNGDKFYTGVVMAVTPERYRSFDSLVSDLTRALISSVTLPNGVRAIYTMDGRKVQNISDLEDGKCYVCSGQGETFKKVEYSSSKVRRGSSLSGLPQSPAGTGRQTSAIPLCVKARIVTLIRHGTKPRKVVRLLLNKRNAPSLEHALEAITEAVKLDCGSVRKVYTLSGQQITALEQFFETEEVFLAYGTDKSNQEDFELDFEESKSVQSFRRGPCISKRQSGPMPRMPRKSGKKALSVPQVRTPSPGSLLLPQPLRLHYAVGHVIGDGNFAVVRHCVHKTSGMEYAMKIVDKYKCQGKETMLASEVAILRQVCHPNIISLITEQETTDQLFLVMELVKGGDLFDAIAAATKFSEAEASVMVSHLTSALAYLHSHHIVHRDVKPENLLVEMEGSHVRCLKLGDFGLAQVVREPLYTVCGTPTYVAPEILAEVGYGLKIDVWAAGVILYILLCGFPPFVSPENEQEELFERILGGQYEFTSPYWDCISDSAKELISNMLQAQPELRFSAEDVLDHPWLASFLGGEPTAAAAAATPESSQQYGNKQRQPIRMATFDFDYKKQRRAIAPPEEGAATDNVHKNRWSDVLSPGINDTPFDWDKDEVDVVNGNRYEDDQEPVSLSADCLQDIRALTTSVRDLMNNPDDLPRTPKKRSRSNTSSLSSIPENVKSQWNNANGEMSSGAHGGSATNIRITRGQSPTSTGIHSSKRNGNSLSDIHSRSMATPSPPPGHKMARRYVSPKCTKPALNKSRQKYLSPGLSSNSGSKMVRSTERIRAANISRKSVCDIMTSSTDGLTGSSDNDIETSDSFVNIQFAKIVQSGQRSSSTQSMESTDSFENVRFTWDTENKNVNDTRDFNENSHNTVTNRTSVTNRTADNQSTKVADANRKTTPNNQSRLAVPSQKFRSTRSNQNSVQSETRPSSSKNTVKAQEVTKGSPIESVKRREKRQEPSNDPSETKTEVKNKRFSCFTSSVPRRTQESKSSTSKSNRLSVKDVRKFRSTDELREEKQKECTKPKRFSLYYTPQLARKTYEPDTKLSKTQYKTSHKENPRSGCSRLETAKRKEDNPTTDKRDHAKNRKSVLDGSTAASRNRTNKGNVHIRTGIPNANIAPTRTK
ncbi:serine/threonine-protein kinase DCLK1 isoform X2 [Cephus cinctus]|uniref:non-specific serine/threonine protein kinase n=1 Tax=Cephus cinctus TaxID=211228 RepID=A0AAJ7W344_CEPCN|nr:serine/threonine-protein kinase DCLK1 isoform X2 [Cephus cinctus]